MIANTPNWNINFKILESYWEQPDILIDGVQINVFPDLSNITMRKRKELKFLMSQLQDLVIGYRWGYPFKLILTYNSVTIVVRSLQEANAFQKQLWVGVKEGREIKMKGHP